MHTLGSSGQAQFDSYPLPRMWSGTSYGSWLGICHSKPATIASWPCLRACSNICPHNWRWSQASKTHSCHWMPVSLSWAIILFLSLAFISYPSSLQPNGKLLERGCPVIFFPGAGWAPKGVLGKLATWPPDYTLSMRDDLVLKRGREAAVWLRSKKCSFFSVVLTSLLWTVIFLWHWHSSAAQFRPPPFHWYCIVPLKWNVTHTFP